MRALDVWEEGRGAWRWRYRHDGMEMRSNRVFASRSDAEESARISYPGIPISLLSVRRWRRATSGRAVLMAGVVAAALAVAVARRRRRRTVRVRPLGG